MQPEYPVYAGQLGGQLPKSTSRGQLLKRGANLLAPASMCVRLLYFLMWAYRPAANKMATSWERARRLCTLAALSPEQPRQLTRQNMHGLEIEVFH